MSHTHLWRDYYLLGAMLGMGKGDHRPLDKQRSYPVLNETAGAPRNEGDAVGK